MKPTGVDAAARLALIFDELKASEHNLEAGDLAAARIVGGAASNVVAIRDHYAGIGEAPVQPSAAHEIKQLADVIEAIGKKSGNQLACDVLRHASTGLTHFVMAYDLETDTDGRYLFRE